MHVEVLSCIVPGSDGPSLQDTNYRHLVLCSATAECNIFFASRVSILAVERAGALNATMSSTCCRLLDGKAKRAPMCIAAVELHLSVWMLKLRTRVGWVEPLRIRMKVKTTSDTKEVVNQN
eukprot:4099602-Amphidinium_carterae.1